jgi:subtilisin
LVELSAGAMLALKRAQPGLRIVPEVFYQPARAPRPRPLHRVMTAKAAASTPLVAMTVVMAGTSRPVRGALVVAFTEWVGRRGASGTTNAKGQVTLRLPGSIKTLQRVYIYPADSAWPALKKNYRVSAIPIAVTPIDVAFVDARVACYPERAVTDGEGVVVGVIDTGVGPHAAVPVSGGANTVVGESPSDWRDADEHGTHVAGIIAGRGTGACEAFRGVAPGVTLRAYRVFGRGAEGASNFSIAKAIDTAVHDGCDLLNLSLGGGPADTVTSEAIKDARARGTVCVIAAGNDGGPVSFPGRHDLAVCVSALGKQGTWPAGATQADDVTTPVGAQQLFLAAFSNRGPQVDLAGPGLGIISSVPEDLFAVMDGTSMACPAVTGALARRLAATPAILAMPRDASRSDAIVQMARTAALDVRLPTDYQGAGLAE